MKKLHLIIFTVILIISLYSCKKQDNTIQTNNAISVEITKKIIPGIILIITLSSTLKNHSLFLLRQKNHGQKQSVFHLQITLQKVIQILLPMLL